MRLILRGHTYRYAAEQMMLTLFPEERPGTGENRVTLSLSRGAVWLTARAKLEYEGRIYTAVRRAGITQLTGGLEDDRVCQRVIKLAFYYAGVKALGREPPWGALTGVRPVKIPARALESGATARQAERTLREVYRVSAPRRALAMACAAQSVQARRRLRGDEVSIYVGIPFCPSRCAYCSFVSEAVGRQLTLIEPYLQALERELESVGGLLRRAGLAVRSVYIGGGTPTTLTAGQLDRLLGCLEKIISPERCTEFTVEAGRPDTIDGSKLAVLASHGVGRVSVNPQSMDDGVLRRTGRPHTAQDIRTAFEQVRRGGGFAVNMDLIAGLPGDTPEGFAGSVSQVIALGPENITVHTLALKKGARLMEEAQALPSGQEVEEMLRRAQALLSGAGYAPYYLYRQKYMSGSFENVGWTRPGFASLYNIAMMEELHSILALGGGGVTKLVDARTGKIQRLSNPKFPREYLRDIDKICLEKAALTGFFSSEKGEQSWHISSKRSTTP